MCRAADMKRTSAPWAALFISLALLLAWDASGADLALSRALGGAQGFAWRESWTTRVLLHDGGRWLAALVVLLMSLDAWRPWLQGPPRAERAAALGVVLLCLLAVPALKRFSLSSCPWDLAEFGGVATYVSHWRWGVADGGPGACFPSGHAVAAWAFIGMHAPWRAARPRLAAAMLAASFSLGLLFSAAQVVRGAHFLSHGLWSAWMCLALTLAAQAVWRRARPAAGLEPALSPT
jgi:membrane-associated PAP2 superfamily phosphatase